MTVANPLSPSLSRYAFAVATVNSRSLLGIPVNALLMGIKTNSAARIKTATSVVVTSLLPRSSQKRFTRSTTLKAFS